MVGRMPDQWTDDVLLSTPLAELMASARRVRDAQLRDTRDLLTEGVHPTDPALS